MTLFIFFYTACVDTTRLLAQFNPEAKQIEKNLRACFEAVTLMIDEELAGEFFSY